MLTFDEMKETLVGDLNKISYDEFREKTNLNKLWAKHIFSGDIRYEAFDGDKEAFLRFFYDKFIYGFDNFIHAYYDRRVRLTELPNFNFSPLNVRNGVVKNAPDGIRYIRSMFFEEMSKCRGLMGYSMYYGIRDMYQNGIIKDTFFIPSVFKDYDMKRMEEMPESLIATFRTRFSQMSVFSPRVYRTFLRIQQDNIKTNSNEFKLLCPTASWGSPVIAAKDNNYHSVHLVDVQKSVLDKCHIVKKDVYSITTLFDDSYEMKTFWTPSENMSEMIDDDYDHVFFCPPYFSMELYGENEDMQSTTLYDTYDKWLDGYWRGTVNSCYDNMKSGAIFSFVINNHVNGKEIGQDMLEIAKEKFVPISETKIMNNDKNINLKVDRHEIVYEMRKK